MNFAIIGSGWIASTMAKTLAQMPEVNRYAIASRDISKAEKFKAEYGFEKAYGSYDEMLADKNVDLVYVATPHSLHCENTLAALEAGHHVLVEKAFAVNAEQARKMVAKAKEKNLLLAEAIWTRYMPARQIINAVVSSGYIGEPTTLQANLGHPIDHVKRIIDPALAGGALLDLTVYPLNFMSMVFGDDIKSMNSTVLKTESGVDGAENIFVEYKDGRLATLFSTIYAGTDCDGFISGRKGYIRVANINNPDKIEVFNPRHELQKTIEMPPKISGYEYQIRSVMNAIKNGKIECDEMPHSEIIKIMEWCDELRRQWNIKLVDE